MQTVIPRFRISATFDAEPLRSVLEFWARVLGAAPDVAFAPYNQPLQTLLDPAGIFAQNCNGANVLLARWEDLAQFKYRGDVALAQVEANAQELLQAVRTAAAKMAVPLVFCVCPPSPSFGAHHRQFLKGLADRIEAGLDKVSGVHSLSHDAVARLYPVDAWDNPQGEELGRIPYTDLYFAALGTAVVRLSLALNTPPYKVITLDCDNTLWKGICGEDGPDGVVLDRSRRELQQFMLEQREAGALLCMASKSNECDVLETFAQNPAMPLQLSHFTASRINWETKSENLLSLSAELNLGLDSFILVDDDPKECAEVEDTLPEVLCLTLPEDDAGIPQFLRHVWAFDRPVITDEDRQRGSRYAQTKEFGEAIRNASDLQHFYDILGLRVNVELLTPRHLSRAAQLTRRTSQFNFTTVRRNEAEIQALMETGRVCLTVDASDRFGDYGIIGLVILEERAGELSIDTFLLSCRALGRGVEHRVMRHIGRIALERDLRTVVALLSLTAKNMPARRFLESVGAQWQQPIPAGFVFRIPASRAATLEWKPGSGVVPAPATPMPDAAKMRRSSVDYNRIARALAIPEQILEQMRRERRSAGGAVPVADPPRGDTEVCLAVIWSDLLERASISRHDNFFGLGGHSLLAVLLLVRIKEALGVDMPIDDVYTASMTLAGMAAAIDARVIGALDQDAYESLLAQIEGLSDAEVRALLEQEQSGQGRD
ncbi:MAG: HAD-IIIC family phosphatase [Bryobacteraceae bacterium]